MGIDMDDEVWKDIVGYEGSYQISNLGRIKSLGRVVAKSNGVDYTVKERIIKLHKKFDYYFINLWKSSKCESPYVHKVVALHFIGPPKEGQTQINHKNGIKTDNRADNLEWCTVSENALHSMHVLGNSSKMIRGTSHRDCKFSEDDVRYIREVYIPRHPEYGARALSRKYDVGHASILKILDRRSWDHVE